MSSQTLKCHYGVCKGDSTETEKTEGRLLLKKAALPLRVGEPLLPSSLAHSRFTPCFSSFCLALPGRLKAPSCGLGKPELRAAAASCWK